MPLLVCSGCLRTIDEWHAFYDLVQQNEKHLKTAKSEENLDLVTEDLKNDIETRPGNYTVFCIGQVDEKEVEIPDSQSFQEDLEDVDWTEEEATDGFVMLEDVGTVVGVEHAEVNASWKLQDEVHEQTDEQQQSSRANKTRSKAKRTKSRPSLDFLTQRDKQDELIRQFLSLDCDLCSVSVDTFEDLLAHYKTRHNNAQGYIKCCQKTFKRRYVLLEHVKVTPMGRTTEPKSSLKRLISVASESGPVRVSTVPEALQHEAASG